MKTAYNKAPLQIVKGANKEIYIFSTDGNNIDPLVVQDFGNEWLKFQNYSTEEIKSWAISYFDILDDSIVNKNTYALDIGCGTGRWTKYLSERAGFIEAVDPSNAVLAADYLLGEIKNVRIAKASVETIPFDDETFDFVMSIGVLHHIPDTQMALTDCVKKVKKGGYFYVYLYHNLENRGLLFKSVFYVSEGIRKVVSKFPPALKRYSCDLLAVTTYMPFVATGRFLNFMGLKKLSNKLPLRDYQNKSFFIIRNDALDKYGTTLEQRFSKEQVIALMKNSGLDNIKVSPQSPYYHAVGQKM
ncbi:MAG: class I SAM-dependent methyltransferase [Ginsengibacter sp.]